MFYDGQESVINADIIMIKLKNMKPSSRDEGFMFFVVNNQSERWHSV